MRRAIAPDAGGRTPGNRHLDGEAVLDIGSITKQFTGAAILRLEMDGRITTADTLGTHVEDLPADIASLTLHQLLRPRPT